MKRLPPIPRLSLHILAASVALSVLLGAYALLAGSFGWLEVRVLLTSVVVTVTSVCTLGCGAALAAGRGRTLPRAGIGLAAVGGVLVLIGMWWELHDEGFWRFTVPVCALAAACAHVCLLSLARLADRYRGWRVAATAASFLVSAMVTAWFWFRIEEEMFFRLLGVASLSAAGLTLLMPILHKLSANVPGAPRSAASIDAEIRELRARIETLERLREGAV